MPGDEGWFTAVTREGPVTRLHTGTSSVGTMMLGGHARGREDINARSRVTFTLFALTCPPLRRHVPQRLLQEPPRLPQGPPVLPRLLLWLPPQKPGLQPGPPHPQPLPAGPLSPRGPPGDLRGAPQLWPQDLLALQSLWADPPWVPGLRVPWRQASGSRGLWAPFPELWVRVLPPHLLAFKGHPGLLLPTSLGLQPLLSVARSPARAGPPAARVSDPLCLHQQRCIAPLFSTNFSPRLWPQIRRKDFISKIP